MSITYRRIVPVAWLLVTALILSVTLPTIYRDTVLNRGGVGVVGSVTKLSQQRGECGLACYIAAYRFDVAGATIDGKQGVPSDAWALLSIGSLLDVVYDPFRPSQSEPRASVAVERNDAMFRIVFFLFLVWGAWIAMTLDASMRQSKRRRAIAATGSKWTLSR